MAQLPKPILGSGVGIVGITSSQDETTSTYRLVIKGEDVDGDRVLWLAVRGHDVIEVIEV